MADISTYLYLYDVPVSLSLHPFISVPVVAKHILKENIYEVSENADSNHCQPFSKPRERERETKRKKIRVNQRKYNL